MPHTNEERFRLLAGSAPAGIFELGANGEFLYGNARFRELVGIGDGPFDSETWLEATHPDDREGLVDEWAACAAENREFEHEYRLVDDDGETTSWVLSRAVRADGDNGESPTFVGILTDITARKQAEGQLALGFEVMRDMAEGVCVIRAADASIVFANPTFEEMMGYESGELHGESLLMLQPPRTSPDDWADGSVAERLVREGKATYDARKRRKDGSVIWCRTTVSTFDHTEHGTVWVSVQRDVTEEHETHKALRAAEERFRRAFEDSASGMALIEGRGEQTGRFREVNRALVQMSGYAPEELLEMSYWDLVHPDEVETMRRGVLELVKGNHDTFQAELRMIGSGDVQRWIAFNVSLLRDPDGELLSAVVQAQDVTERKRFETELQYLADHDPLTGIYNRRRFAAELERELAAAERYETGGALLILDLDAFKLVNDSRGHSAGDELLVAVARAIQGRLRTSDIVGRLGGDEFGIVLPHAGRDEAIDTAESLRAVVGAAVDAHSAGIKVTTSVGVATFGTGDGQARGVERLVSDADAAMYEAKQAGRDRVRIFTEGESRAALRAV